jgi:hypothetical protein
MRNFGVTVTAGWGTVLTAELNQIATLPGLDQPPTANR